MANQTVSDAKSIRGTDPQLLIEKIVRTRIYDCRYWKEECFALTAELLVDNAMKLRYIGGVYGGNVKPTPFICLLLKMLQIQPEKDIIVEFITQPDFKYVRALGAMYMRMTGSSIDCYKYLEPLYLDYRRIRAQSRDGKFFLSHIDEFVDDLLTEERACDTILPRIMKRILLEEDNKIELRASVLNDEIDDMEDDVNSEVSEDERKSLSPYTKRRNERMLERDRNRYPRSREEKDREEKQRRPRGEDRRGGGGGEDRRGGGDDRRGGGEDRRGVGGGEDRRGGAGEDRRGGAGGMERRGDRRDGVGGGGAGDRRDGGDRGAGDRRVEGGDRREDRRVERRGERRGGVTDHRREERRNEKRAERRGDDRRAGDGDRKTERKPRDERRDRGDRERTRKKRSHSPEHKKSKSDHKSSSGKSSKHKSGRSTHESAEIKAANELRAKLGINPLRP